MGVYGEYGIVFTFPIGFVLVYFLPFSWVEYCLNSAVKKDRQERHHSLRPHFGDYWKPSEKREWYALINFMNIGGEVRGNSLPSVLWGIFGYWSRLFRCTEKMHMIPTCKEVANALVDVLNLTVHRFGSMNCIIELTNKD